MTVGHCERQSLGVLGVFLVVGLLLSACGGGGGGSGPFIGATPSSGDRQPEQPSATPESDKPSTPSSDAPPNPPSPPPSSNPSSLVDPPVPPIQVDPPPPSDAPPNPPSPPPSSNPPSLADPPVPPIQVDPPPPPPPSDAPRILDGSSIRLDPVLILKWSPPVLNDGASILRYEYRVDDGDWQPADGTLTTYVFHNLQDGTTYRFQVRAVIEEGGVERYSTPSDELTSLPNPTKPGDLPGVPGNLQAYPGNGRVLLTWNAPDPGFVRPYGLDQPGFPGTILFYLYEVDGVWRVTDNVHYSAHLVTGLVNGQSYTFRVKVMTVYHFSEPATVSVTPSAVGEAPGKPREVTATLAGGGWTDLIWEAPVWDGGAEITSYEYAVNGGMWQTLETFSALPYNNCPYRCRYISSLQGLNEDEGVQLRARNQVGPGDASAVTQVRVAGFSVEDAETQEADGAAITFTVRLNSSDLTSGTATVDYATSDGTATAGADYTETSGTLTFGLGETTKTISVPVLSDATDEDAETFTLALSNAVGATISDGTATGTITNTGPLPQAWLARFGRTVATHVTDAVSERLRGSTGQGAHVTVGGYRLPLGKNAAGEQPRSLPLGLAGSVSEPAATPLGADPRPGRSQTLKLRDLLPGSSFRLALGGDDDHPGALRLTAWGRVAGTRFKGQEDTLALDGDVLTGTLGVDSAWDRWLAGVAVSHSRGDGSFTMPEAGAGTSGELDNTLTSVHPYLRYAVTDRLNVWGLLGYGWGELTLKQGNGMSLETDMNMIMGAFGGRGILLAAAERGGVEIATRTDAMLTRTSSDAVTGATGNLAAADAEAHRLRVVLEGSRGFALSAGRSLAPSVEVGLRHDWGDAETGFGLEVGGRVRYADPGLGLTIEGAVRALLAHEDSDYKEWGASGTVRLAPGPAGQGLALTLSPTWGAASSGVDGLWSRQTTAGLAQTSQVQPATRLNAEVGYGVVVFDKGLLTPYAGTVLTDGADQTYRVGTRWIALSGLTMTLEGTRQESAGQQPVNQGLQLQVGWGF